uniref:Maltose excess protein 1-like, chloroplastic n=1 Tax=Physcomitrium patens TaxID=3218 RepID=A0A7I4CDX5_PHYPA|nr:maltose excess protein 1-like, chloroplastic isoform X2 [Physcomitrium patens]|eukprot:XP_024361884.1 maltose excess protein 1-like, chloroplastic isoform X2 [Physcomitrella patens]
MAFVAAPHGLRAEYGTFSNRGFQVALGSGSEPIDEKGVVFSCWDKWTGRSAECATLAFLFLQLPQIILNTKNLLAGEFAALFAVPWMGQLTGLLGNLSLLSYFASKRERGAMIVQGVGVGSTLIVLMQLAIAGAMPLPAFGVTTLAVVLGYILNILNYQKIVRPSIWQVWEEAVTIGGVTVLPQVMWSTFEPFLPHSLLPAIVFGGGILCLVILARLGKLSERMLLHVGGASAWTATLLFMWGPVAQMWTNFLNPANIKGLSSQTVLLAMIGNGLLLPRALFIRDLMWFTGSSWGCSMAGEGILISMYINNCVSAGLFWIVSTGYVSGIVGMLYKDRQVYGLSSIISPLLELVSGSRRYYV